MGKMALDRKDLRILQELDYNARMPLSRLGLAVGLSAQLARYRLNNLVESGVIRGAVAVIDVHRLGYFTYRIYLRFQNADVKKEKEVIAYFVAHPRAVWVVSLSGGWDMEVVLLARNSVEVGRLLQEVKRNLGGVIRDYAVSPSVVNYHFPRKYLGGGRRQEPRREALYGFEPQVQQLDKTDAEILGCLSVNARMSNQAIAAKLGLSHNTVKARVRSLEKRKVIQAYRLFVDISKAGRQFYKAVISTQNYSEKERGRLFAFCSFQPCIAYLVECFGEWDLEVEAEVKDEAEFREMLREFRNEFAPLIREYSILHVYREHKLNYLPMADALIKEHEKEEKES